MTPQNKVLVIEVSGNEDRFECIPTGRKFMLDRRDAIDMGFEMDKDNQLYVDKIITSKLFGN